MPPARAPAEGLLLLSALALLAGPAGAQVAPPPSQPAPPAAQQTPPAAPAAPGQDEATPGPAAPPEAQPPPAPAPARPPGRSRSMTVVAVVGGGRAYGQSYFLMGGRFAYGVALGFQLSLDAQWWTGATPALGKLAPGLLWVAPLPFRPYLGGYYAHWFVGSGLPDDDALGARAGLHLGGAGPAVLAVGVAYERLLSCQTRCESWWPEVMAGVSF